MMMDIKGCLLLLVILATLTRQVSSQCTLPTELQNSQWTYVERSLVLTFTTTTMSGLSYNGEGTPIANYNCISSDNNVIVWKSSDSFTSRGQIRNLVICMKFTKVSENQFYFHLLSDVDVSGSVSPTNQRIRVVDSSFVDSDPACSYCQYQTGNEPTDGEAQTLQKMGTSEAPPAATPVCLPCSAVCSTEEPDTCKDAGGKCKHSSKPCTNVIDKKCKQCHHRCCLDP